MRAARVGIAGLLLGLGLLVPAPTYAVTIGLIDTFEDGTTENWIANLLGMGAHPAPPTNVPTGGPGGAGDNYLLITAVGGSGNGSRLTALNPAQWAGDYLAAGVTKIAMDVINLGGTDLFLRLEFEDPTVGPPINVAFSSDPIFLPSGSGWQSVVFPVVPSALTAGLGSVTDALANTTILRIYHSPGPNFPNPVFPVPAIVGQLGVDNITAVPEPSSTMLLAVAFGALLARRAHAGAPRKKDRVASPAPPAPGD